MPKLRVFLSHLNIEAKFADTLTAHLTRDFIGLVDLFVASDATSIPVGSQWLDAVMQAIETAQLHIIVCSSDAVQRPWINYEAGAARLRRVPMIPLCHSGVTPEQLPVPLSESEGVIATDAKGLEKLYHGIARLLDADIPAVDFEEYAKDFRRLEEDYATQRKRGGTVADTTEGESITNPRVVCVTSTQFYELGFKNQMQLVLDAFPHDLKHDRIFNSAELQQRLATERVDIVHIAAYVCPRTGELYFSDVDLSSGRSAAATVDRMGADALAALLTVAGTRLVVISSCDSLALATTLLNVTNVIAARDMVSVKAMASWLEAFYRKLGEQPLAAACDYAFKVSQAPMRLYAQQHEVPNVRFTTVAGEA